MSQAILPRNIIFFILNIHKSFRLPKHLFWDFLVDYLTKIATLTVSYLETINDTKIKNQHSIQNIASWIQEGRQYFLLIQDNIY